MIHRAISDMRPESHLAIPLNMDSPWHGSGHGHLQSTPPQQQRDWQVSKTKQSPWV